MNIVDKIADIFGFVRKGKRNELYDICKCGHEKGEHVNPVSLCYGKCRVGTCDCDGFVLDHISDGEK